MIVCFGSVNLDLIFAVPNLPTAGETVLGPSMTIEPGGKGANQAVAAARDGAHVVFAGAVGPDAMASDALSLIRKANIDVSRIVVTEVATGCAAICVDPSGQNLIAVASGANLMAHHEQVEAALLGPGTTVLVQMEVPRTETEAIIRRARAASCRIVLNLAPAAPLDESTLRAVDLIVVNEGEAAFLGAMLGCPASPAALHARLNVGVVVTLGKKGVKAKTFDGSIWLPAHPVNVVDTTGAGDCFAGVLAAALDRGLDIPTALARANIAAGLCCTHHGTQGSMPTAAETAAAVRK